MPDAREPSDAPAPADAGGVHDPGVHDAGVRDLGAVSPELDAIFAAAAASPARRPAPAVNRHVMAFRAAGPRRRAGPSLSQLSLVAAGAVGLVAGVVLAPQVHRPATAPPAAAAPASLRPAATSPAPPPVQPAAAEPAVAETPAVPAAIVRPAPVRVVRVRHRAAVRHPLRRPEALRVSVRAAPPRPRVRWAEAYAATSALNRAGYPYVTGPGGGRLGDPPAEGPSGAEDDPDLD